MKIFIEKIHGKNLTPEERVCIFIHQMLEAVCGKGEYRGQWLQNSKKHARILPQ
jgi:hypothetical protein